MRVELDEESDDLDDAVKAFLALVDPGKEPEAGSLALSALSRQPRSLSNYAAELAL